MSGNLAAQLKKAVSFHEKADYAHSVPLLRQIVRQSPGNYDANLLLGEDLLNSGNIKEAVHPLEVACKVQPSDGTAEVYLADAAVALDNFPMAVDALQAGMERSGGAAPFLESWAGFCLKRFKLLEQSLRESKRGEVTALRVEAAIRPEGSETREKLLEQVAAGDPDLRGIWGELGTAQLERGMFQQARQSLAEAQRREPHGAETLQAEALLAAVKQDWPAAEQTLTEVAARSPAELQNIVELWRHVFLPRIPVASAAWDCLRDVKASCPAILAHPQGGVGLSAKDLYAEGRWEQLISLPPPAPTDTAAILWRGVAMAKIDQCAQAIVLLERGLSADGLVAKFWLGVCYGSEEERVLAQVSQHGNAAAFHRMKGDTLLVLRSDALGAKAEYEEALKSDPRNQHLLNKLAEAYTQLGDTEQAEQTAKAALDVDVHDSSALETLADLAIKKRDYATGVVWLKQLLAINPRDSWTQVELGVAYGQLGQPEQAVRYLEPQLAAGYPDDKGALHAMLASALRKLGRGAEAKQAAVEAERLASSALKNVDRGPDNAPQ